MPNCCRNPQAKGKLMGKQVLVTEIQRFAVNDGPGFRTNVFLKGCPLKCQWCHNPETMSDLPDIYWKRRLCVQCGECMDACPNSAINPPAPPDVTRLPESGYQKIIRLRCDRCMKCISACRYEALTIVGNPMSIEDILEEVERDRPFYDNSGGGMTLSGGEPTAHADFSIQLLHMAKQKGIHICLDTNGFCDWLVFQQIIEHVDIVLFDLKHVDPAMHQKKTGVSNAMILKNLARLSETGKEIWVRIPVIPGFNDSMDFHIRAAEFLSNLPGTISRVDLLAYHNWCQDKYDWLGIDWKMKEIEATEPSFLEIPADVYREKGLTATVGGSGFESPEKAAGIQ